MTTTTNSKQQLALFQLNPKVIGRQNIWLRDVVSESNFALVHYSGDAYYGDASFVFGVRPVAAIG